MKTTVPQLKTCMTPFPYAVDVGDSAARAQAIMDEHAFHHLPVTREGHVVGILTAGMLEARRREGGSELAKVSDLYRYAVHLVEFGDPLAEVVAAMAQKGVDAAVVMRRGKLVGVFTATDAFRAFAALLREMDPVPGGDDAA